MLDTWNSGILNNMGLSKMKGIKTDYRNKLQSCSPGVHNLMGIGEKTEKWMIYYNRLRQCYNRKNPG